MKSTRFTLSWQDVSKALAVMLIANIFALVMGLPEGQLPTWTQLKLNIIMSLKFSVIPYIIKNFFTDDVKSAEKVIDKAHAAADNK